MIIKYLSLQYAARAPPIPSRPDDIHVFNQSALHRSSTEEVACVQVFAVIVANLAAISVSVQSVYPVPSVFKYALSHLSAVESFVQYEAPHVVPPQSQSDCSVQVPIEYVDVSDGFRIELYL